MLPTLPTGSVRLVSTPSPWRAVALALVLAASLLGAGCGDGGGSKSPAHTATGDRGSPTGVREDLVVGIGDQQAILFGDPRFKALGLRDARFVASYDTTSVRFEREIADNWLGAARRAGVHPFVTFGHSRVHPKKLPSVAEFRAAFRAFHKRYPQVDTYAPWNEINHVSQPTSRDPARAAAYYNVVRAECDGCTVVAGDVLDQAGMTRYVAAYRRGLDGEPKIWGLHNYADANRFRKSGLSALLKAVPGEIWLTETGGIVQFGRAFPRSERRAARAVRYAFDLAVKTKRVRRIYLYNWTGGKPGDRFDAGIVGPDGSPRPAYDVLRKALTG
jgi:hypothetical protein